MGDSSRGSEWAPLPCVLHGRACSTSTEAAAATWVPDDAPLRWATAPAARNGHISRAHSTGALAPPPRRQLQPGGPQMMLHGDGRQLPRVGMGTSPAYSTGALAPPARRQLQPRGPR